MDRGRVKNLILLLLVLINLILGVDLVYVRYLKHHISADTVRNTCQYLAQSGVTLPQALMPSWETTLQVRTYLRDSDRERAVARSLIGPAEGENLGGGMMRYRNRNGEVTFRRGAQINGELAWENRPQTLSEGEKQALDLLRSAEILPKKYLLLSEMQGESVVIRLAYYMEDCSVINSSLTVAFLEDRVQIDGFLPLGRPRQSDQMSRSVTALLADFGATVQREAMGPMSVERMETVFYHAVNVSGNAQLTPCLCLETDRGTFLVNGIDGTVIPYDTAGDGVE